ncbi:unnamed protein product [Rotaria socialis]|uniref:Cytochrome b561 domain-containing protein n=2 Tax=Rotaria socialis TaxID=392032 RepID=A0A817X5E2_9BILA|nr:unnamed protein product [Rotaria socialis]CAF3374580.1 unnamed protein product [Rotaria socialis]CAF3659220.1 unnamed protein product [Rotaria socialis]CAF4152764.1 unnamed protein product [Rotaria socialis]CAF4326705.1 unnamed protein product [Rotaria socialis]
MALFRCHPDSPFRFIFNWVHRTTGMLAFTLSVPTIFLVVYVLLKYHNGFVAIMSLWSAWIVILFIVFEVVQYRFRLKSPTIGLEKSKDGSDHQSNDEQQDQTNGHGYLNKLKLILFLLNFCFAISLVIPLVVLIWMQG